MNICFISLIIDNSLQTVTFASVTIQLYNLFHNWNNSKLTEKAQVCFSGIRNCLINYLLLCIKYNKKIIKWCVNHINWITWIHLRISSVQPRTHLIILLWSIIALEVESFYCCLLKIWKKISVYNPLITKNNRAITFDSFICFSLTFY